MRRDKTKHGPRLDDELKKEVESLTRGAPVESRRDPDREQEGASDGEREPSSRTAGPDRLGPDESTARAELSRHLRASAFPADRDRLIAEAGRNDAPAAVVDALQRLPVGASFATVYEVWEALGGRIEHVAGRPERHSRRR